MKEADRSRRASDLLQLAQAEDKISATKKRDKEKHIWRFPNATYEIEGTMATVDCAVACINNGCYDDDCGVEEMYDLMYMHPETKLPEWRKKKGSNKDESFHRLINDLVSNVSHTTGQNLEKRIWLRIGRYNFDKDKEHGRVDSTARLPWSQTQRKMAE